ncbi:MAG: discoidin domain-containing protein [Eubacterium sp.]|nr:discoidin domain-containing protein [Eubacterium sp.]
MRKKLSKLLSVFLSVTMVFSSAIFTNISVKADMTTEQMVASAQHNLALKKTVEVAPSLQEGNTGCLTDGKFTPGGEHAATTFGKAGTYYQVDLGAVYDLSTLDQLVVGYKENSDGDTPTKGYKIQISANGLDFTDAKSVAGAHVKDACTNNNLIEVTSLADAEGKAVRYIRLYYPDSYTWGIQVTEIAVLDIDENAAIIEVEKCDDAAGVTVTSPDYNTLTYNIQAGENQEGYKYIVYLLNGINDRIIGYGVEAGKDYVVENLFSGMWTVKVIACYNGAASDGILSEKIEIAEIGNLFNSSRNIANAYAGTHPAKVVEMKSIYEGHSLATAAAALDGRPSTGEGSDVAMRTGAGSPQHFVIDLGEYYTPQEMQELLLAHTNANTYASDVKVEFSLDGNSYTEVGNKKGYVFESKSQNFCAYNRVPFNKLETYTDKAVRFVKVTLSGGASNWGYVINEVGVIANTDEPTIVGSNISEAADIIVDTSNLERITYSIVAGEEQEDATYVVSLNEERINSEAKAGVEYEYGGIEAGTYEIKVSHLEDGWLSKGITKSVVVDGYINYVKTSLNLALKSKHSDVTATCDNDNYKDNYLTGSQDISAGVGALNNGVYTDYAHHTGYLQTRPDNDEANIIYDLGKEYDKNDIHSLISMYEANSNAATEYEIYVSSTGEEETYEKVFYVKNAKLKTFPNEARPVFGNDVLDMSEYTQDTVRFVKLHIITGNYARHYNADGSINWGSDGYHLCELAVMGKESLLPEAPKNVSVTSPEYDTIVVKWDDIADENAKYNIYMDGNILVMNEPAGVNEKTLSVAAGTHKIAVSAVVNGMERSSEEYEVNVETEVTTPVPTTPAPTQKPTEPVTTPQGGNNNPTVPSVVNPTTPKTQSVVQKPGKTKITKTKAGKKKVLVKFKRVKGAQGYRIQYSLKANFKKAKKITTKKLSATIKRLKKGKRYYIRVQAYKVVRGKKVYGAYSKKVRSKKIK